MICMPCVIIVLPSRDCKMLLRVLLVLTALALTHGNPQDRGDGDVHSQLFQLKALVEDLRNTTQRKPHGDVEGGGTFCILQRSSKREGK